MKRPRIFPELEHRSESIVPMPVFILRVLRSVLMAGLIVCFALFAGMPGYHYIEGHSWVDAFLNASMILSGMGPASELHTQAGKIFAGFYALFSGLLFIVVAGIILAPLVHRFLHRFHLDGKRHG